MAIYDDTAGATVRIACGSASGSGFHFHHPGILVTCYHVIEHAPDSAEAFTESGERWELDFVGGSEPERFDFAIYQVVGDAPNAPVLLPDTAGELPPRGIEVVFAGFPHGVPDLLLQRATVAGVESDETCYLDGSVNGGNSGGPIVDAASGKAVPGSEDLEAMAAEAQALYAACRGIQGGAFVMGIDFGAFAQMVARTNLLLRQLLEANANTGIGLRIDCVVAELEDLSLA